MIEPNRQGEVWVYVEQEDGSLHDVALELCGKARELADKLGVKTGAVLPGGVAVFGLPGNPVSAMVTARRFATAVLRRLGGFQEVNPSTPTVTLSNPDDATLHLWWYRLIRLTDRNSPTTADPVVAAELLPNHGSGDVVALARSHGFIEVPPGARGRGPWPCYSWEF